jgi:hypothetical protein
MILSEVKPGVYRHYKNNLYQVKCVARDIDRMRPFVVYQSLCGNYEHWIRPLSMFQEKIEHDGKILDRFTYLNNNNTTHCDPIMQLFRHHEDGLVLVKILAQHTETRDKYIVHKNIFNDNHYITPQSKTVIIDGVPKNFMSKVRVKDLNKDEYFLLTINLEQNNITLKDLVETEAQDVFN